MNFKSALVTIALLSSAFSLHSVNQYPNKSEQIELSAEDEQAFSQLIQQMISIIVTHMVQHNMATVVCNGIVYQIENDELVAYNASDLNDAELDAITDISEEVLEELASILNSISAS